MKFRPCFSVRTLAIFVTLICVYFGSWEATKRKAARENLNLRLGEYTSPDKYSSPIPFLVVERDPGIAYRNGKVIATWTRNWAGYHVWLFRLKVKLPFESTWK